MNKQCGVPSRAGIAGVEMMKRRSRDGGHSKTAMYEGPFYVVPSLLCFLLGIHSREQSSL